MLNQIFWFVEQAMKNQGGIWLAIPSGMLTGFPITPQEYIQGLVAQGTIQKSDPASMQTEQKESASPDEPPFGIYLSSATLFVGNTAHGVGYAIVDGRQVSAFGWFDNITATGPNSHQNLS